MMGMELDQRGGAGEGRGEEEAMDAEEEGRGEGGGESSDEVRLALRCGPREKATCARLLLHVLHASVAGVLTQEMEGAEPSSRGPGKGAGAPARERKKGSAEFRALVEKVLANR